MSLSSFVTIAKGEVGNGPEKYRTWYGQPGDWCAMFVCWCANQAGILCVDDPSPYYPSVFKTPRVQEMYEFFTHCNRIFETSMVLASYGYPKVGDIAFINGTSSHVGIVVENDGYTVKTVEGNTTMPGGANGVTIQTYNNLGVGSSWELTHIGSNHIST